MIEGGYQMKHSSNQLLELSVVADDQDFVALEEEWEELYQDSPLATPFQSWAWLYTWWEYYGEGYELRLITIRDNGLLVGLMPLMLQRLGSFGRLLFVGTGLTDYQDVLVREGWERRVSEAGVQALRQIEDWQVADFQQLRPEATTWSIFEEWTGPRTRLQQDNCPSIEVRSWDELLTSLSNSKTRNAVRRTLRRAEADGVRCKLAGADEVGRAARRWVALHLESFEGRDIIPEHLSQRFQHFLETAACRVTNRGLGGISEFWRDGEVIISQFLIFGRDFVGEHLPGARQAALSRYQVSSLLVWDALNVAYNRNSSYVDLLRGEKGYKLRWCSTVNTNYQAILGSNQAFFTFYTRYHALLYQAKAYTYSEGGRRWVKEALKKVGPLFSNLNKN